MTLMPLCETLNQTIPEAGAQVWALPVTNSTTTNVLVKSIGCFNALISFSSSPSSSHSPPPPPGSSSSFTFKHLWHMEIFWLGIEFRTISVTYITAAAMPVLKPLCQAGHGTCVPSTPKRPLIPLYHSGNSTCGPISPSFLD